MTDEFADYSYRTVSDDEADIIDPFSSPVKKEGERKPKEKKQSRFSGRKKSIEAGKILKNRANSERKESAKLNEFVKVLDEVTPIFDKVKNETKGDHSLFKRKLSEAFSNQKSLVEALVMAWGLNDSKINDRVIISYISKSVGRLISSGDNFQFNKDEALILGKTISEIHKDKLVFGELLDEELISEDIIVNIKATMIEPSVKLGKLMDDLMIDKIEQKKIYHAFHQITYELSQDLAFNWDKDAMVRDRESLFVNIMASCAEVVFTSIKENIVNALVSEPIVLEKNIIWSWMNELNTEIINNDMGYLDSSDTDIYWLKDQLATLMISKLNDIECNFFRNNEKNIIRGYFLSIFEKSMVESWKEESDKKISYMKEILNDKTKEEKEKIYDSEEFRRPMELNGLFNRFRNKTNINFSILDAGLDFEEIKKLSSKNFAMFWGLSNAVCKLRV